MKSFNRQNGVALLEVLIAFVIVMVSVVALFQLHNKYLQNEIASSTRLTALNLAESKLDDLRTFGSLTVSSGVPAYDDILSDKGGTIVSGAVSVGNFNYNLHWTSTDAGDGSKDIKVTVSWNNGNDEVSLYGSIARADRISEAKLISTGSIKEYNPQVVYTPGIAPDIVSITLPDGSKKETTKPLPTIKNSDNGLMNVSFETVTYKNSNTQVLDDYATVSCDCSYTDPAIAFNPAEPTLTDDGLLYWKFGTKSSSTKSRGTSTTSTLCNTCCQNHFDGNKSKFEEVYNRLNVGGDKYNITGSVYPPIYTSTSSGKYYDSCRLMRIDGYYKPLPDWNLVKLVVMSKDFLTVKDENLTNYQNYVSYVVMKYVEWQRSNWSSSWPVGSLSDVNILDFDAWYDANPNSNRDANGDKMALSLSVTDNSIQLISRGIFVDNLSPDWLEEYHASTVDISKVPFYDINMTLLTRWHPNDTTNNDDDVSKIRVLNEAMSGPQNKATGSYYSDYYRRGVLTPVTPGGPYQVTAEAYYGNSAISAYIQNPKKDEVSVSDPTQASIKGILNVTVTGSTTKYKVRGRVYCFDSYNSNSNKYTLCSGSSPVISITPDSTCYLEPKEGSTDSVYKYQVYECDINPGASITASFSINQTDYDFVPNPASITTTATQSITNGGCVVFYKQGIPNPNLTCPTTAP
ncbi:type IV pilus modification PilV family protein [Tolumonas osonensis]|uniref:Tfp pilus assembly protein PilV n=1 Tax=Tolumonas osonensis TaxID=675874 RepID=A0A841GIA9_9GAMM|nr:hypothetical protein [Tolumonas osonensis]MBB6055065.1 Tfp pilus assembly protein PilV [Tolumonas osonensis]